jgi:hypothetical protein
MVRCVAFLAMNRPAIIYLYSSLPAAQTQRRMLSAANTFMAQRQCRLLARCFAAWRAALLVRGPARIAATALLRRAKLRTWVAHWRTAVKEQQQWQQQQIDQQQQHPYHHQQQAVEHDDIPPGWPALVGVELVADAHRRERLLLRAWSAWSVGVLLERDAALARAMLEGAQLPQLPCRTLPWPPAAAADQLHTAAAVAQQQQQQQCCLQGESSLAVVVLPQLQPSPLPTLQCREKDDDDDHQQQPLRPMVPCLQLQLQHQAGTTSQVAHHQPACSDAGSTSGGDVDAWRHWQGRQAAAQLADAAAAHHERSTLRLAFGSWFRLATAGAAVMAAQAELKVAAQEELLACAAAAAAAHVQHKQQQGLEEEGRQEEQRQQSGHGQQKQQQQRWPASVLVSDAPSSPRRDQQHHPRLEARPGRTSCL